LAVFDDGAAVVVPWRDVVALHELQVELLATDFAAMPLLLPHGEFDVLGECSQVEVVLVARQHVGDDARLTLYLAVAHQFGDATPHRYGVKRLGMVLVVEQRPVEALHNLLEPLHVEVVDGPVLHRLEILPQVVGVRVVLMFGHIADDRLAVPLTRLVVGHPFECPLQEVLTDGCAVDQVLAQAD